MKTSTRWPLIVLLLLCGTARLALADHYVARNGQTPMAPYASWATAASNLQEAVDAASSNSTVWVGAGTYIAPPSPVVYGGTNVVYVNKPLTLRGASGNPADTIIDGQGLNRGIALVYGVGNKEVVIDGLTIRNGAGLTMGGGILVADPVSGYYAAGWTARVQNCLILSNTVAFGPAVAYQVQGAYGGGIGSFSRSSCKLTLTNCVLRGNVASNVAEGVNAGGLGGGIYHASYGGTVTVQRCQIQTNTAYRGGNGFISYGMAIFEETVISGGRAIGQSGGSQSFGGGFFHTGSARYRNCLMADNSTWNGRGAAINEEMQGSNGVVTLENCTVAGNLGGGYAIYIRPWAVAQSYMPSLHLVNSIVYSNTADLSLSFTGELPANYSSYASNSCLSSTNANVVTLSTNLLYFKGYSGGTFTNNPQFANCPARDFHLSANSPCRNSGANQPWMTGTVDLDGQPRVDTEFCTVDMGCYESHDAKSDRYVAQNGQTPAFPFRDWATAASNIQDAVNAASPNTTVWIAPGRYTLPGNAVVSDGAPSVVTIDKPITVRSSSGTAANTFIDGGGSGRGIMVTYAPAGGDTSVIQRVLLQDLTVCNGLAKGGGISFSPGGVAWTGLVQNCVISGNTTTNADAAGGLLAYGAASGFALVVSDSVIGSNSGGGLCSRLTQGGVQLSGCRIEDNAGTGITLQGGTHSVRTCLIRHNGPGGGVRIDACTPELWNCTVVDNSEADGGIAGVRVGADANVAAWNCIIVSNYAGAAVANGPPGDHGGGAGYFYLNQCCVYPTAGVIGTGNSEEDPGFADYAGGDFRLTEQSPCVNTGTNQSWMAGAFDLDGHHRVDYGEGVVDRGCYERLGYSIVKDGQAGAEIVIAPNPPRMAILAADELRRYVFKITGAQLPIVTNPTPDGPTHIFVGESADTLALGLTTTGLQHDAFQIASGTNWLALVGHDADFTPPEPYAVNNTDIPRMMTNWDQLTGNTWGNPLTILYKQYSSSMKIWSHDARGSLNAVHQYLRDLGVRWYSPGDLGEVVPAAQSLALPATNAVVRPDFGVRHLDFYYHQFGHSAATWDEVMWQLRLGLNWGRESVGLGSLAHGIQPVISRSETATAHPEYYKMRSDGTRETPFVDPDYFGPCLSSEGLYTQNLAYAQALCRIYSNEIPILSVMPTDGYWPQCYCPLCVGKSSPERGSRGLLSDYVWAYVNRAANDFAQLLPDRKVSCCAYGAYQLPPTNIATLSSNIIVGFTKGRVWMNTPESWAYYTNNVLTWMAKLPSGQCFSYDYYLTSREDQPYVGVPVYFPHLISRDLKFLKGKAIGEYVEVFRDNTVSNDTSLTAYHLNCYVTARLYWNADQDVDALLDDYYQKFYGPAANEMKQFVEYLEANWQALRYSKALLDEALARLTAARQAAGQTVYGQRIDIIVSYVAPLVALRDAMADHYVAQSGQTPVPPYLTWETAASNIQDAVNAGYTNSTIWIGPGRYTAAGNAVDYRGTNVVYLSQPMALRGLTGVPEDTVIDGGGACRGLAVRYVLSTSNQFVLDGLTFANGVSTNAGGAVLLDSLNTAWTCTVRNCVFQNNAAVSTDSNVYAVGGAVYDYNLYNNSGLVFSNCVFRNNRATNTVIGSRSYAGAVYARNLGAKLFTGCLIESNSAAYAGGLYSEHGTLCVENTIIRGNRCELNLNATYGGGGVRISTGSLRMKNCLMANNVSAGSGGAIACQTQGSNDVVEVINCTIVTNSAPTGGGIYIRQWSQGQNYNPSLWMANSIVYSNAGGNLSLPFSAPGSAHWAFNSCFTPTNLTVSGTNVLFGSGNISTAPALVSMIERNFRLAAGSPCRDTGTNQAWMAGAADLDGNPRIDVDTGIVDMGCYEFIAETALSNAGGATGLAPDAACLNGLLTATGGKPTSVTIFWGTSDGGANPEAWAGSVVLGTLPAGPFSNGVTGLLPNTTYYYRCCATNAAGSFWASSSASFTTPAALPAVNNAAGASGIGTGSGWLNGELTSTGGAATRVFIHWGPVDGGATASAWAHLEDLGVLAAGVFTREVTGLDPNTPCFYRCYATNVAGGAWASTSAAFTTLPAAPAVDNGAGASGITAGSAWLNGNLTATGGVPTQVTLYWGPTDGGATPTNWAHSVALGVRPVGLLSNQVAGLAPNATYCYRYCAVNVAGTTWAASPANFTTLAAPPAVDNDGGAASVGATRAWLRGTLTSAGGLPTAVTIYWGLTDGGTTNSRWSNTNQLGVRSIGLFSNEVTTLTMNRTYYYRCFASNALGGVWASASTNFTTTFDLAQVDNDGGARGMTISAAWLRGTLTSTGGVPTAVFIYSGQTDGGTNPASWSRTNSLGIRPTGLFSNQVTALQTNALYYYRCCASNVMGRSWAAETTNFWTLAAAPAVNNTNGATGITSASAWLRGTLTSTGGAPTTVIIYWGPTDRGASSSGWARTNNLGLRSTGIFSNQVSGLTANTRYYYRCCATNKAGLAWASTTANFKTLAVSKSGGNAIAPAALSDLDGDGATYDDELRTGTDPDDNYSFLRIMAVDRRGAEDLELTLYLGSNHIYNILSVDPIAAAEPFRASITSGTEGIYHWIDTNAASHTAPRFYRLSVSEEGVLPNP